MITAYTIRHLDQFYGRYIHESNLPVRAGGVGQFSCPSYSCRMNGHSPVGRNQSDRLPIVPRVPSTGPLNHPIVVSGRSSAQHFLHVAMAL